MLASDLGFAKASAVGQFLGTVWLVSARRGERFVFFAIVSHGRHVSIVKSDHQACWDAKQAGHRIAARAGHKSITLSARPRYFHLGHTLWTLVIVDHASRFTTGKAVELMFSKLA